LATFASLREIEEPPLNPPRKLNGGEARIPSPVRALRRGEG